MEGEIGSTRLWGNFSFYEKMASSDFLYPFVYGKGNASNSNTAYIRRCNKILKRTPKFKD